jgi:uncharacterized protein YndB with AHSA1/START domain
MTDPRRIEVEVEVPGTPEQVWEAIATGPGVASWFMPMEIDGREGGTVSMDFGAGMEPAGTITAWDPPRRFATDEDEGRLASEWLVEARSGGTCVVRLVTSAFGEDRDWDDELESMREGWQIFFHNLRVYLTEFAGRPSSQVMVNAAAGERLQPAWTRLRESLGWSHVAAGERVEAGPGAPELAGTVERVLDTDHHAGVIVRTERPGPGVALVFANAWRGRVYAQVAAYLFGGEGADRSAWQEWLSAAFAPGDRSVELEAG